MKSIKKYRHVLMFKIVLLSLVFSFNLLAQTQDWKVKKEIINEVPVYIINTGSGDQFFVSTVVNYGSMNDEPIRQAGLAHFFEHFIHDGNQVFPNAAAVKAEETRLGAGTNAYTSADKTFYFLQVPKEKLEGALRLQGSMMSGPAWLESEFVPEMKTVMDEALKYQNNEIYFQLTSGMHLNLLPEGHPFKTYNIGTQEQLAAMTMDDVKDIYYREYIPQNTNLIICGNFSGENEELVSKVQTWVEEHYHFPQTSKNPGDQKFVKPSIKDRPIPNYYDGKTTRAALEMHTPTQKNLLQLNMLLNPKMAGADFNTMEILTDYLSLKLPGSFYHSLVSELEWATSVSFDISVVGQRPVFKLIAQMTEEGAKHRYELITYFYNTLNNIKTNGISEDVLALIKKRNINSYTKAFNEDIDSAANSFSDFIKRNDETIKSLDFENAYGKIESRDVQSLINFFNADQILVGYIGPQINATKTGPVFKEKINLFPLNEIQPKWQQALTKGSNFLDAKYYRPILKTVPYMTREYTVGAKSETQVINDGNNRLIYRQSNLSPDSAINIQLINKKITLEEYIAKTIFSQAFQRSILPEISYMAADNIHLSFANDVISSAFYLEGNSLAIQDLTHWLVNKFQDYNLTEREFEQTITRLKSKIAAEKNGMTAHQSVKAYQINQYKNLYLTSHFLPYLEKMTAERINSIVKETIYKNIDVNVMAWGDFSNLELTGLNQFVKHTYPEGLTQENRNELKTELNEFSRNETYYYPLSESASEVDYGLTRVFKAPNHMNKQEFAGALLLANLLADQLYHENRQVKGLGYVQSASFRPASKNEPGRFILYGQTETLEKLDSLKEGLDSVIKIYQDKMLPSETFENQRYSIISQFEKELTTPGDELNRMATMFLQTDEISYRAELIEAIKALSIDDIYLIADKYLVKANAEKQFIDFVATRSENFPKDAKTFDCDKFLKP